jgi:signal transduction histidine kinase
LPGNHSCCVFYRPTLDRSDHELRTPLSAIRGRLEGMLDGGYPADEKHLSLALKANYLLERLVKICDC